MSAAAQALGKQTCDVMRDGAHHVTRLFTQQLITGSVPRLWHSDFKEKNVSSPLSREDSVLWGPF